MMERSGLCVLIVEDEPVSAMLLQHLIEEAGHSVCGIAADSREALQAIEASSPDIVFMDLVLKDGPHGLDLTRRITGGLKLPVIILSGVSDDELLQDVPESGALSFLAKPVHPVSLRMNLRIALRHQALEKELAANEEKYHAIYNNAAMGIYLGKPEGAFLTCNQAFATMLGYADPDELLALLRNPDEQLYYRAGRRQQLLALLREQRAPASFESEVLGRDGDLLWISESCTPVFDAAGALLHYEGVVTDISARKRAEYAFRTTYNLIRTTIDSLYDGILVTDLDGHLIMANSAAVDMLDRHLEEGEKIAFLAGSPETSPFARFQKTFDLQTGAVAIVPGHKPVYCMVVPYKSSADEVIGAVHVLRRSVRDDA
ncbi:MAG: response regulator [Deltaproteobacteria bacterium]|jgi:PAS domain S-box-containing protein|nr:response regulator [Deltaproteobacteria bacterium]